MPLVEKSVVVIVENAIDEFRLSEKDETTGFINSGIGTE